MYAGIRVGDGNGRFVWLCLVWFGDGEGREREM